MQRISVYIMQQFTKFQDKDIDVSLRKLSETSALADIDEAKRSGLFPERKFFGFIRLLQILPRNVIAFTEAQVQQQ